MLKESKLKDKCQALLEIIRGVQNYYGDPQTSDSQKAFIETVVGAAIWYLPKSGLWSRSVSLGVLDSFDTDTGTSEPKLSEEHMFPRKYSAQEILEKDWSNSHVQELVNLYLDKLGKFNYVTPSENKQLAQYQKTSDFISPEKSYGSAGISLVSDITDEELKCIKNRDKNTIERLKEKLV